MKACLSLLAATLLLASCSYSEDPCATIIDETQRQICRQHKSDNRPGDEGQLGVGPPSCHPGSTNPDRSRDRC